MLQLTGCRWFFQQLVLTLDYLHQKQPGVIQDIQLQDLLLTVSDEVVGHLSLQRNHHAGTVPSTTTA